MSVVKPAAKKVVVVGSTKRDWIIGIVAGAALLGFLLFGIWSMSSKVASYGLTGMIMTKTFTPQTEEQLTIGKSGVHERKVDGTFTLEVRVESEHDKIYTVWVDKTVYDSCKVGAPFSFMRPPPK